MSTDEIAIRVENLSKCYQMYNAPIHRLQQFILPRLQHYTRQPVKQYFREFWALRDISFSVKKGETLGIVGRNGAGKSTLLQLICGTLTPTHGHMETHGRIAAILELGSGFNPEFTGRENVYLNAAVHGLSVADIEAKFDAIAAFADIGDFLDQPVKTYSSGMAIRLAFAVQAQIDPDILIVDEALAVGDAKFQAKCFERLRQLKDNGTSILLVTHSSEQIVSHCTSAILLHNGTQWSAGKPRQVVNHYMDLLFGKEAKATSEVSVCVSDNQSGAGNDYSLSIQEDSFATRPGYNPHEYRWGDQTASILDFYLMADTEPYPTVIHTGQKITLALTVKFHTAFYRPIFGLTVKTKEGITLYGANSETLDCQDFQGLGQAGSVAQILSTFDCRLAPGDYFISLGIASKCGDEIIAHDRRYDSIHLQIQPNPTFFGLTDLTLNLTAQEITS